MEFVDVTYYIFFSLSLVRCTSLHEHKNKDKKEDKGDLPRVQNRA